MPTIKDTRPTDSFPGLWKHKIADPLVPERKYSVLPYDSYCPSVKTKMARRVCKTCEIYYPSIAALKRHAKVCSEKEEEIEVGSDGEEEATEEVEYEMKHPS